jgi:hypothetical protein
MESAFKPHVDLIVETSFAIGAGDRPKVSFVLPMFRSVLVNVVRKQTR